MNCEEMWVDVPKEILKNDVELEVSNRGQVRYKNTNELLPIINAYGNKNTHGKYPGIILDNDTYYLHHLIYKSFHPEIVENDIKGKIMFKNFTPEMLNENQIFRAYLEDLVFIPKPSNDPYSISEGQKVVKKEHPIYGTVTCGEWLPLYVHRTIKKTKEVIDEVFDDYEIMFLDNCDTACLIRSFLRTDFEGNPTLITIHGKMDKYIGVTKDKVFHKFLLTHVMLSSAFPEIEQLYTVDHIDDNPLNNHICNLQWMTRSENSKKGQVKSCQTVRDGKGLIMLAPTTDGWIPKKEFKSICNAANYIKKERNLQSKGSTIWSKIRRSSKNQDKGYTAYGYRWEEIEIEESEFPTEEEWRDFSLGHGKYQISNYGRIKNTYSIVKGCKVRGRKYRMYDLTVERLGKNKYKSKKFYVHQLVWIAFNGPIPKGKVILHDEDAPLDEDGCYRNWLSDLKLGTRSENNFEHNYALKAFTKK